MEWFRKAKRGLTSQERRNIPEGLWTKCPSCGEITYTKKMEQLLWVCPNCQFHFRIASRKYIELLLDDGALEEFDTNLHSVDPLKFRDSKKYTDRLKAANEKSGGTEGLITGLGAIGGIPVSFAIMDFNFIGGSMGSVVGEKVART
ncbi:MAG: acetyl-CoA carboxylase carboxyl transferase subunit beta, partial [Candidatus Zixiibacteriota bacterium]